MIRAGPNRPPEYGRPHRRNPDTARGELGGGPAMAMGGVLGPGGLRYFYSGGANAMNRAVTSRWPVSPSTYPGHPGGANAVDYLVANSFRSYPSTAQKRMGNEIANFVAPPATQQTIWDMRINNGGGWEP